MSPGNLLLLKNTTISKPQEILRNDTALNNTQVGLLNYSKLGFAEKARVLTYNKLGFVERLGVSELVGVGQLVGVSELVGPKVQLSLREELILLQKNNYIESLRPIIPRFRVREPEPKRFFTPPTGGKISTPVDNTKRYGVEIKSKGRWKPVKSGSVNYYGALGIGSRIADEYTEKSFRVYPMQGKAKQVSRSPPERINKFYQPSKTQAPSLRKAWIEKNKFAIDSYNEKLGIPYKGQAVLKQKRGFIK
jgi:hypothetical protein